MGKKIQPKSYSQFSTFASCPRRWQLSQRWDPKHKAVALTEGDLYHKVLAKFYSGATLDQGMAFVDAYANQLNAVDPDRYDRVQFKIALLRESLAIYFNRILSMDLQRFEVISVEEAFEVKLAPGLVLRGFVDGVLRDKVNGVRYILEHKYKQDHESELMPLDLQVSTYTLGLLPKYGLLPTMYNVARKPLYKPKKNESAVEFGTRNGQVMNEEIKDFQWTPMDYESRFYVRQVYSRGAGDLDVARAQLLALSKAMDAVRKHPERVYRNVGDHCLYMCPFREVCLVEEPIVINRFFVPKSAPPAAPPAPATGSPAPVI